MIERKTLQAGALVVTPVQRIDHVWVKRDDLYHVAGVNGGKARRIVVPVGSGLSLAGVLIGLQFIGRVVPVLGVVVGRDPARLLNKFAPQSWGVCC